MEKVRLVIVDDHALFREGLRLLLEQTGEFTVVGEATNGKDALDLVARLRPDVVLMDITMPIMDGLAAARALKGHSAAVPVLFLTVHDTDNYFFGALEAGASGYVVKDAVGADLVAALRVVKDGGIYLSPAVAQRLVDDYLRHVAQGEERKSYEVLTHREREILALIGQGYTNKEMADLLTLSVNTVQTHRLHIMEKLNLHSRAELMKYAIRLGLVHEEPPQ